MKRRDFVRKSIGAGIAASSVMALNPYTKLWGKASTLQNYDLVAAKGGEPGAMFDRAIQSMGGMEKFVKKGQKVVIKPNIGWDAVPERAANTNPQLVGRIIEHCLAAGAKDVYVFDHTINEWTRSYKNSGIEKATKDAGGKIVAGNSKGRYHQVDIPGGKVLKQAHVHELILESDVFINVPILKHHGGAGLCVSMKNLMGAVWDRRYWHANDLHQCIADFTSAIKPDLNVVDGYKVLMKNGPRGVSVADVETRKFQIISTDMVSADVAATKFLAKDPSQIGHIRIAGEMGLGEMDLSELNINRIQI
ncbi:MAG TPA: DUF362 domain-containing protein [Bacteroides sp.]|nr:DUF362 domain-containing protein [Bacteroides sp.]